MTHRKITLDGVSFPIYTLNTLIIGSGAAGLNAAVRLHEYGQEEIAIVTDRFGGGTSANAGSDKQTYYKLSLSGNKGDSARAMARDLFAGGCMHGDIALCEAENSSAAFFHLVDLGVPFPHDRFGGFAGYRTDHDPRGRAISAGPLTSQWMVSRLAQEVRRRRIPLLDRHAVIGLLSDESGPEKRVIGAVALDTGNLTAPNLGFVLFNAQNIILATGGPAGIYRSSVYPRSQNGSTGLALGIGAVGQNLMEWQFGLASTKFRWNLSGSYQQAIPRYFSTDRQGKEEHDFLADVFPKMDILADAIFRKGYEWPLDAPKVFDYRSSLIDLLVFREIHIRGRRVFLDFRRNPKGTKRVGPFSLEGLSRESYSHLKKSKALKPTPIERLDCLNRPAIEIFKTNGIDIRKEPLEIDVCAQHNNGGLRGNEWWESNVRHLFPIGEVCGTHGVHRPGGAALNSGQVGGMRAALFISRKYPEMPIPLGRFLEIARPQIGSKWDMARKICGLAKRKAPSVQSAMREFGERTLSAAGIIRSRDRVESAVREAWEQHRKLQSGMKIKSIEELPNAFRAIDLCLTHALYMEALLEYLDRGGMSRGSGLVTRKTGDLPCGGLPAGWKFGVETGDSFVSRHILEIEWRRDGRSGKRWVAIRPIPAQDGWFETVWNEYREERIVADGTMPSLER